MTGSGMSLSDRLDSLLAGAVDERRVPGVAFAAATGSRILYLKAHGERVLDSGVEMTPDTIGNVASMTKAVTAAAAMQLVERGALELDRPASDWLPDLDAVEVLVGFGPAGEPRTRPPRRPITLRHLLTHTSGFVYDIWNAELERYLQHTGLPRVMSRNPEALRVPLLFDPGGRWEYGVGMDWTGLLVEAVSGQRLGEYFGANIFAPLGMSDTAYAVADAERRARVARIHQREPSGRLTPLEAEAPRATEHDPGGGGLYSTVRDYLAFTRMLLAGGRADGRRILQPETVRRMASNHLTGQRVTPLRSGHPTLSHDVDLLPGIEKSWGLSFMINEAPAPTGRAPGSLAWAGLTNCYYWIDRTKGVTGVYLSQVFPFADPESLALFESAESAVYDALAPA